MERNQRFTIVVRSALVRQLPLALSGQHEAPASARSTKAPRQARARYAPPRSSPEALVAAVRRDIEACGEELVLDNDPTEAAEPWLSPTKAGLRYGEVWIAKTADNTRALVRVSGYRSPQAPQARDKRPYRRWFGIDLLGFVKTGARREVRIAQVLKGGRC